MKDEPVTSIADKYREAEIERQLHSAEVWLSHLYDFRDSMHEALTANPSSAEYAIRLGEVARYILEIENCISGILESRA